MSVQALHGITLESMLTRLVEHYGWEELGRRIDINCFIKRSQHQVEPEIPAQDALGPEQVEKLYLDTPLVTTDDAARRTC